MNNITLKIDSKEITASQGTYLLKAAQEAGIYIPALCNHPDLKPVGYCGLCVVEIEGQKDPVLSCNTVINPGMAVKTNSEKIRQLRQAALAEILKEHPHACLECWRRSRCKPGDICLRTTAVTQHCVYCPKNEHCELQRVADYVGVLPDIPYKFKEQPVYRDNPYYFRDYNLCINCTRCVRVCQDVRCVGVYKADNDQKPTRIMTTVGNTVKESGCVYCYACVEVCPTGAIMEVDAEQKYKTEREAYIVPCSNACPAHINIPRYVKYEADGRHSEALAVIREKVPFPGSLGRVCIHPCEQACRREQLNSPISIKELKRTAADKGGDSWRAKSIVAAPTGHRVAIVGGGPSGLTAAFYLAKKGHKAVVFEALPEAGGMMRVGIPEYRLPRDILAGEIDEIRKVGVEIKTNSRIESVDKLFEEGFEAVFLAPGAHKGLTLGIEGEDLPGVVDVATFLREVSLQGKSNTPIGNKVAVVGGGNSAIDGVRVALRLGAKEVTLIYRRTRKEMPAAPEEVEDAVHEGVKLLFLTNPSKITRGEGNLNLECVRMTLGEPDESGRRRPIAVKGSEFVMQVDSVIAGLGQAPEIPAQFGVKTNRGNTIKINEKTMETSRKGVFAAGDAATGPASVIEAIAGARQAASSIDKFFGGNGNIEESLAPPDETSSCIGKKEGFADWERENPIAVSPEKRVNNFNEALLGFSDKSAAREGDRCLQCQLRLRINQPPAPPICNRELNLVSLVKSPVAPR